jgi:2-succinyl-6-hydroxy-2,4-cyclohexadiene-1-carboxylate synthase
VTATHTTDWRPGAGALAHWTLGDGPSVVLLHGFTQGNGSWRTLGAAIAAAGYRVTTVDLPGHGASAHVRADLRRTADLIADTLPGPAAVVGYSLGGRVALHLALAYPHQVERLATIGAHPGIDDDDERAARRRADDALAQQLTEQGVTAFVDEWLKLPLFGGLQVTGDDLAERRANTAEGLASSLRLAGTGTQLPLWSRLRELTMPALVMAGALDTKFAALAGRLAGSLPNGRPMLIDGAHHAAHLQQPDAVRAALLQWLAIPAD